MPSKRLNLQHQTSVLQTIMDAYSAYAYSTAVWLSLQALPLSVSPKLIVTMLSPETRAPTGKVAKPCKAFILQSGAEALL